MTSLIKQEIGLHFSVNFFTFRLEHSILIPPLPPKSTCTPASEEVEKAPVITLSPTHTS